MQTESGLIFRQSDQSKAQHWPSEQGTVPAHGTGHCYREQGSHGTFKVKTDKALSI